MTALRTALAAMGYVAVGFAAFAVLVFAIPPDRLNRYDEGLVLVNAMRLLDGQVPYRDFWTIYAPAQFWALAGWFTLLEPSVLAARLWDALARALLALACFDLVLSCGRSRGLALTAAAGAVAWLWYTGFFGYPLVPASAAALGACAAMIRWETGGQSRYVAIAGALTAVAALFRHDLGAYTAVAVLLSLPASARPERLRTALRFVGVVALAGLPAAVHLLVNVPFAVLWQQLIAFPATVYPEVRALPFPDPVGAVADVLARPGDGTAWRGLLRAVLLLLPLAVCCGALILGLAQRWRPGEGGRRSPGRGFGLCLLGILGVLLFFKSTVRPSVVHLLPALLLVIVIALMGRPRSWPGAVARAAVLVLMALVPLVTGALAAYRAGLGERSLIGVVQRWQAQQPAAIPRARGFVLPAGQAAAVRYLRRVSAAGDVVFVAAGRHDRVFVSDMMFYFLAERLPAAAHAELHPGAITTAAAQRRVVRALAERDVQWVVRWQQGWRREPNASAMSSGVTMLDCVLRARYRVVEAFDGYEVLRRKGDAPITGCRPGAPPEPIKKG